MSSLKLVVKKYFPSETGLLLRVSTKANVNTLNKNIFIICYISIPIFVISNKIAIAMTKEETRYIPLLVFLLIF
jgi:hypothetical protein